MKFGKDPNNVHYKDGITFQEFFYIIYVRDDYKMDNQDGGTYNTQALGGNINKLISTSFNDINEQLILLKLKKLALLK